MADASRCTHTGTADWHPTRANERAGDTPTAHSRHQQPYYRRHSFRSCAHSNHTHTALTQLRRTRTDQCRSLAPGVTRAPHGIVFTSHPAPPAGWCDGCAGWEQGAPQVMGDGGGMTCRGHASHTAPTAHTSHERPAPPDQTNRQAHSTHQGSATVIVVLTAASNAVAGQLQRAGISCFIITALGVLLRRAQQPASQHSTARHTHTASHSRGCSRRCPRRG